MSGYQERTLKVQDVKNNNREGTLKLFLGFLFLSMKR